MDAALAASSMPFGVACDSHSPLDAPLRIVRGGGLLGFAASGPGWADCPQRQHRRGSELLSTLHCSTSRRGITARIYNCPCAHRALLQTSELLPPSLCARYRRLHRAASVYVHMYQYCTMRGYRQVITTCTAKGDASRTSPVPAPIFISALRLRRFGECVGSGPFSTHHSVSCQPSCVFKAVSSPTAKPKLRAPPRSTWRFLSPGLDVAWLAACSWPHVMY